MSIATKQELTDPSTIEQDLRWIIESGLDDIVIVRDTRCGEPKPSNWRELLTEFVKLLPSGSLVGPKRLTGDGHVFSMGEFVIHPKGFHHHGNGVNEQCYRFPEEVDAIAGGVMVLSEETFNAVDGESILRGELSGLTLGLEVRRHGGRCFAVPQVVIHDERTPQPSAAEAASFADRFGFQWHFADLDVVQTRHAGSPLLWNARYQSRAMPFEKYGDRGALVWKSYQQADFFRKRAHHLAELAKEYCPQGTLLDLGCGDGLFAHLMAKEGLDVIGIDPEAQGIEQCLAMTASHSYPGPRPRFEEGDGTAIPLEADSVAAVTLFDVIEHLPNPIAVLREITRVLQPGGSFLVVTPSWQFGGSSDPIFHGFEYTKDELERQVGAVDGFTVVKTGMVTGIYRDLIVIAKKC